MANFLPGIAYVTWTGPETDIADLGLDGKVLVIYDISLNRQGDVSYLFSNPGFAAFSTLKPAPAGARPQVYRLLIVANFTLPDSLVGIIAPPNGQFPSVTLAGSTTGTVGTQQSFQATATDPDGSETIAMVELCAMANSTTLDAYTVLDTDMYAPYVLNWTPTAAGNFNLRARVTDDKGNASFSSLLTAVVSNQATPGPVAARRSVTVHDAQTDAQVATLASDEPDAAESIPWDGTRYDGAVADTSRSYVEKRLSHSLDFSVEGTWKGVLGNNSDVLTGPKVRAGGRLSCQTFYIDPRDGQEYGAYGQSYQERNAGYAKEKVGEPGVRILNPSQLECSHSVDAICNDGVMIYRAGISVFQAPNPETGQQEKGYFSTAEVIATGELYPASTKPGGRKFYTQTGSYEAFDIVVGDVIREARGNAVQQNGSYYLATHLELNRIAVYDKRQLNLLFTTTVDRPSGMSLHPDDKTVAVIHYSGAHDIVISLYTIGNGTLTLLRNVPVPLGYIPVCLSFSPDGNWLRVGTGEEDFVVFEGKDYAYEPSDPLYYTQLVQPQQLISGVAGLYRYTGTAPVRVTLQRRSGYSDGTDTPAGVVIYKELGTTTANWELQPKALNNTAFHRNLHYTTANYDTAPTITGTGNLGVSARVTDDTICRYDTTLWQNRGKNFIAHQLDGSYRYSDFGHRRNVRRTAAHELLGMQYDQGFCYGPTVNALDPSDVRNDFLGFNWDRTKERLPNNSNGWWQLTHNWSCFRDVRYDGLYNRANYLTTKGQYRYSLERNIELTRWVVARWSDTDLVYYPDLLTPDLSSVMDDNLDLLHVTGFYPGETKTHYRQPCLGVDAQGKPSYGTSVSVGSALLNVQTPNATSIGARPTDDGVWPVYFIGRGPDFQLHLGGIKEGETGWHFQVMPATWMGYLGEYPKAQYDTGNQSWGTGSIVLTCGKFIVAGVKGEGWKQGQCNLWLVFTSAGQYVGTLGTVRDGLFLARIGLAAAGQGGNAFQGGLFMDGTKLVLLIGDESAHGGFQIFELETAGLTQQPPVPITVSVVPPPAGVDLLGTIPFSVSRTAGQALGNITLGPDSFGPIQAQTSTESKTSVKLIFTNTGGQGKGSEASFPIGTFTSDLDQYEIVGWLARKEAQGDGEYATGVWDLEDQAGLIALRFQVKLDGTDNVILVNGVEIDRRTAIDQATFTYYLRQFRLQVTSAQLKFQYAELPEAVLDGPFNPNANHLQPRKVRFSYTSFANGGVSWALDQWRFLQEPNGSFSASARTVDYDLHGDSPTSYEYGITPN